MTDDFPQRELNRRRFLETTATNAAGVAAGVVGLSSAAQAAANETVRLGVIGVRSQGKLLAKQFAAMPDASIASICDVDQAQFASACHEVEDIQQVKPRTEADFRRLLDADDIDAVVIAVPEHWHAPMALEAVKANKDVYLETPVSHTIAEGLGLAAAVSRSEQIVQVGLQQRSGSHFQSAIDFLQSGGLGRVNLAKAWTVHRRKPIGTKKDGKAPQTVDYKQWLGPAPGRAFNSNRYHHNWRWFWDYGSGEIGQWGVHLLDIARWGLGVEFPSAISASGGKYVMEDQQETPDTLLASYRFSDGTDTEKSIVWEHRLWSNRGIEGRSAASAFYGERGVLIIDRGGWKVYDSSEKHADGTSPTIESHVRNFIDCVKTRKQPNADILTGHQSSAMCHLGNIAYRLRHEIQYDGALDCGDARGNELIGKLIG